MPVITASGLAKRIGDRTLFADLSFKLDRRERMTLAGRNGSGKTTLLRMLAGEAGLDGGEIVARQGRPRRAARPAPAARATRPCASTCTAGLALDRRDRGRARPRSSSAMADGAPTRRRSSAYADAQARLEHAGGYRWRDAVERDAARPRLRRRRARPAARRRSPAAS